MVSVNLSDYFAANKDDSIQGLTITGAESGNEYGEVTSVNDQGVFVSGERGLIKPHAFRFYCVEVPEKNQK